MNNPKNFALQLGALITLYASLASLITLLFSLITILYPDAVDGYYVYESAAETIRFSIASLIVVFPTYVWLTRQVNQIRRRAEGSYLSLTKWLIYLSLLVGGAILLGDVVAVIYSFLNGELTIRFILKALVLAVIISAAFFYYLKDAQQYWQDHERESKLYGAGAAALVLIALGLGFTNSATPQEVREVRIDNNQIGHLQDMQWRIEEYYRNNESLPETINQLYREVELPTAPEDRPDYEYKVTDEIHYELCATFAQDSVANEQSIARPVMEHNYSWSHGAGDWCFERVIDNVYRQ